jgi:hypothetical protein
VKLRPVVEGVEVDGVLEEALVFDSGGGGKPIDADSSQIGDEPSISSDKI